MGLISGISKFLKLIYILFKHLLYFLQKTCTKYFQFFLSLQMIFLFSKISSDYFFKLNDCFRYGFLLDVDRITDKIRLTDKIRSTCLSYGIHKFSYNLNDFADHNITSLQLLVDREVYSHKNFFLTPQTEFSKKENNILTKLVLLSIVFYLIQFILMATLKSIKSRGRKFITQSIQESILIGLIIFNKILLFGQYTMLTLNLNKFGLASNQIETIGIRILSLNKNIIKELIQKSMNINRPIAFEYEDLLNYNENLLILNYLNAIFLVFWLLFMILIIIFIFVRFIQLFIFEIETCFCHYQNKKGKFRITNISLTQLNTTYF